MKEQKTPAAILADLDYSKPLKPAEFLARLGTFKTTAGTFSKWEHSPAPAITDNGKQPKIKQVRTYLMENNQMRNPIAVNNAAEAAIEAIYGAELNEADTRAALEQLCETAALLLEIPDAGKRTRGRITNTTNNSQPEEA